LFALVFRGQSLEKAQYYLDHSDYRHAVPLYEKIATKAKQVNNLDLEVTAQNGLADCYLDLGATYKAMALLKKNSTELNKPITKNYLLLAKTHQLLAIAYDKLNLIEDYLKECNLFYSYYQKAAPDKEIYKALYYAYVGRYYNLRFMFEKAYFFTSKALKIYKENKSQQNLIDGFIIYNAHLFTIRNKGDKFTNSFVFRDSLNCLINKRYPYDNAKKARLLISLAAIDLDQSQGRLNPNRKEMKNIQYHAKRAIDYYDQALNINEKLVGHYNPISAILNSLKGLIFYYQKDYSDALKNFNEGIQRITIADELNNSTFSNNPTILMDLYNWKAVCLDEMYLKYHDPKILQDINTSLLLMEKVYDSYINQIITNKKQYLTFSYVNSPYPFLINNYFNLFEINPRIEYLEKIYEYDEKSKY